VEQESVDDAMKRVASRVRDAERRREQGRRLVAQMTKQIGLLFPGRPEAELSVIAEHTAASGGADGSAARRQAGTWSSTHRPRRLSPLFA
jgi:hypothetical protein